MVIKLSIKIESIDEATIVHRNYYCMCIWQLTDFTVISSEPCIGTVAGKSIHRITTDTAVLTWVRITFVYVCKVSSCAMYLVIKSLSKIESINNT